MKPGRGSSMVDGGLKAKAKRLALKQLIPPRKHKGLPSGFKWLAVCVPPGKEFVGESLLTRAGLTVFLPVETKSSRVNRFTKKLRTRELPRIARYVFVGYAPEDGKAFWQALFRFRIVQGVLGVWEPDGDHHPVYITDEQMRIMMGLIQKVGTNPRKSFGIGDLVRITSGPFEDFRASVDDIRGQKAHILLRMLGSDRHIEIGIAQLEAA